MSDDNNKENNKEDEKGETYTQRNAGYSFLATVIASGIVGFMIDRFADTAPWGILGMMSFGFIYATWKAQQAVTQDKNKKQK